ncbi:hypothetical protein K7X08_005353 [Anisodus acutangulus]|uniref:Uncharacterized protein n=1 Tax=Anisodus acutangulus TaxID=402998 RepID=A0A9Q1LQS0_9SOLA|nr:hypothetical protein K7X08_005353 [Anisodus acutangulus]
MNINCNRLNIGPDCIQIDKADQIASPLRTIGTSNIEIADEVSSAIGPCEVPGDKLAGAGVVGSIPGDFDGVAELDEMFGDADGVITLAGTSAAVGEDAGIATGGEVVTDGAGADPLVDGLSSGEMAVTGEFAVGDCIGDGEVTGE